MSEFGTDAMDDKPEVQAPKSESRPPRSGARASRTPSAPKRSRSCAKSRWGASALLESELKPIVLQAPPGVDLFDLTLYPGRASAPLSRHGRLRRHGARPANLPLLPGHNARPGPDRREPADRTDRRRRHQLCRAPARRAGAGACGGKRGPGKARSRHLAGARRRIGLGEPEAASSSPERGPDACAASCCRAPAADNRQGLGDALSFVVMTLGSVTLICLMASAAISPGRSACTMSGRIGWGAQRHSRDLPGVWRGERGLRASPPDLRRSRGSRLSGHMGIRVSAGWRRHDRLALIGLILDAPPRHPGRFPCRESLRGGQGGRWTAPSFPIFWPRSPSAAARSSS